MKHIFAAILVILLINTSHAQLKLGLKLTSSIITQRVTNPSDSLSIGGGSNAFNPAATLFADLPLSDNYYFSTGLGYISKRVNLDVVNPDDNVSREKKYNIQYVQIPATLRLFTNEISLDKVLYFQFGPIVEIAVHSKEHDNSSTLISDFQPVDVSLLFAGGIQIQLAPQTALQVGIHYTRGLINTVKEVTPELDGLIVKNDLYGIDLALKF